MIHWGTREFRGTDSIPFREPCPSCDRWPSRINLPQWLTAPPSSCCSHWKYRSSWSVLGWSGGRDALRVGPMHYHIGRCGLNLGPSVLHAHFIEGSLAYRRRPTSMFFFFLSIWMNDLQRKYLKSWAGIQRLSSCTHLYPFPTSPRSDILTLFFPCDPTATLCWTEACSPDCVPSSGHCWPQSRPVCAWLTYAMWLRLSRWAAMNLIWSGHFL